MNAPRLSTDLLGPGGRKVLDRLLPMHVHIGDDGLIVHAGPAFAKISGAGTVVGKPFAEVFSVRRPAPAANMDDLRALEGQRLTLAMLAAPDLLLRSVVAILPGGQGCLLDVSLGLSFQSAVARFDLTISDFSPCNQTVELLYLQEAKEATFRLSQQLTDRLAAAHAAAEIEALTDPLTGLANRRALDAALGQHLADPGAIVTLMHIDLDHFKLVNDTHGHAAGDAVLMAVADVLRNDVRSTDVAARVGGDEFVLIIFGPISHDALGSTAKRLIGRIERPVRFGATSLEVSASIGIASTLDYTERPDVEGLMADTDAALYTVKAKGRAGFAIHGMDVVSTTAARRATDG